MTRPLLKFTVALAMISMLAGCLGHTPAPGASPTEHLPPPRPPAKLTVAGNVWALTWLVERIGGDLVDKPRLFGGHVKNDGSDSDLLTSSDSVLYVGNLDADTAALLAKRAVKDPERFLDIARIRGINLVPAPPEPEDDKLSDGTDPHAWLDPHRMIQIATGVTRALTLAVTRHPELGRYRTQYSDALARRRDEVVKELNDLHTRIEGILHSCRGKTIVPEHPAYRYLTEEFGLRQLVLSRISGQSRLEAGVEEAQRRKLAEFWQKEGPPVIFLEHSKGFGPDLDSDLERQYFHRLANEHNADVRYLSSLEKTPEPIMGEDRVRTYPEAMVTNAEQIKIGLRCDGE